MKKNKAAAVINLQQESSALKRSSIMASYQKHYGLFCLVWVFLWLSTFSFSADLYVRPGPSGDGTKASPYNVLWKAMDKALRGDVIHVARGTYSGKGGSGAFIVRIPHLTMVGGYT
ncbi:MAG: hypothetical protein JXJ04_19415, partial [Spirochaetales bacterium]|nr:hypothetical protein [Spirochaetales bacterium]